MFELWRPECLVFPNFLEAGARPATLSRLRSQHACSSAGGGSSCYLRAPEALEPALSSPRSSGASMFELWRPECSVFSNFLEAAELARRRFRGSEASMFELWRRRSRYLRAPEALEPALSSPRSSGASTFELWRPECSPELALSSPRSSRASMFERWQPECLVFSSFLEAADLGKGPRNSDAP